MTTTAAPPTIAWQFHYACINLPLSASVASLESVKRSPFVSDAMVTLPNAEYFNEWAALCGKPVGSAVSAYFARKPYDFGNMIRQFPNNVVDRFFLPQAKLTPLRNEPTLCVVDLHDEATRSRMADAIGHHLKGLEMPAMLIDNVFHPSVFNGWIPWDQTLPMLGQALDHYRPPNLYINVSGHPADFSESDITGLAALCDGAVWETFLHPSITKSQAFVAKHIQTVHTALSKGMDMVACPTAAMSAEQIARGIALLHPSPNTMGAGMGRVRIALEHYGSNFPVFYNQLEALGPADDELHISTTEVYRVFRRSNKRIRLSFSTGQFTIESA